MLFKIFAICSTIPLLISAYGGIYDPYAISDANQGGVVEVKSKQCTEYKSIIRILIKDIK